MLVNLEHGSLDSSPTQITPIGDTAFFVAGDPSHGRALYRSDGSAEGTTPIKIVAAPMTTSSFVMPGEPFASVGETLFFLATDDVHGTELWATDGTSGGTRLVKDADPGPADGSPRELTEAAGRLFFVAFTRTQGLELWSSDGTPGGTALVRDLRPDANNNVGPIGLTPFGDGIVFADRAERHGAEPWVSDGTEGGTTLMADVFPGQRGSFPGWIVADGRVSFEGRGPAVGWELWNSDGTGGGTTLVRDIDPGTASGSPRFLTDVAGRLFFVARTLASGFELWVSDGTEEGTVLVREIREGPEGAAIKDLVEGPG
jgi:ELWxxDGT repeat protein